MLRIFRNLLKSRIGAAVAIAILVLIALAFASGDIASTGSFGGVAGGDRVATVGDERIDTATYGQAVTSALERVKQDDPNMSMAAFLSNDGHLTVLDDLIDRLAIAVFGEERGIAANNRLVDSEIANMPVFRGADGEFSEDIYRQMMQQRGLSEQMLRDDLRQGLIARQVMMPAGFGASMSEDMARRYAALLNERRQGKIAVLPSVVFAAEEEPSAAQLAEFYKTNRNDFIRPERRTIRYATFGADALKNVPEPTEEEIAFRYKSNQDRYAASERRRISQLILPTEAAAKAVASEVAGGKSLEQAASEKGLSVSEHEFFAKPELARQYSQAVANAAFAARAQSLSPPARSGLGWHLVRVEEVDQRPARSIEDVREEIAAQIAAEKQRVALAEMLERVEDEFAAGSSLNEVAKQLGIKVKTVGPVTADGRVYLKPGESVPSTVQPVLSSAFSMDEEEPQLAEAERGRTFIIYDVADIARSAAAPLDEIKDNVKAAYMLSQAAKAARAAAKEIQEKVRSGVSLQQAMQAIGRPLPPVQNVSMTRPELAQIEQQGQQVPLPLALMFSMAEGSVKVQPGPDRRAYFVVSLEDIEPGKVAEDDEMIASTRQQLGRIQGTEFSDALGRAIRAQVGVERNEAGIRAVYKNLGGE